MPAGFGGERVYFACPDCARAQKLYLPLSVGRFACRRCHALTYRSQQESRDPWGRAWAKIHAIEDRLAHEPMRWRTEAKLLQELNQLYDRAYAFDPLPALLARCDRTIAKHERPNHPGRPSKRELRERRHRETARLPEDAVETRPRGRPKHKRVYVRKKALVLSSPPAEPWAFCPRCRDRRRLKWARSVTFANGRPAIRGRCCDCRLLVARITPSQGTGIISLPRVPVAPTAYTAGPRTTPQGSAG